jgi:transposase-like protein
MSETNNQATKLVSGRKRIKFTAQFKLDRSLEILHTDNVAEVARKYAISPNLLYQ